MKPFLNERLIRHLKDARRIFLCTHISPDGDAIGSMLAAKLLLEGMGKAVTACCADPVPAAYAILPGANEVLTPGAVSGGFDAAMSLDAADLARIGASVNIFQAAPVRLQIDHHGTNPAYADENEIDADAPAAGCIVMRLIRALGQSVTSEIAVCLYTAISTDTGNFSFQNTDPEAFEIMSELMKTGFDLPFWARHLHLMKSPEHLRMLSCALSRLTFLHEGRLTVMSVLPQDYAQAGARPEHSENIVNYGMYIPGVRFCCFANSMGESVTKFSLRAMPPYSAQRVAVRLGGGGHEAAAGVTLKLPAEQAIAAALDAINEEMEKSS